MHIGNIVQEKVLRTEKKRPTSSSKGAENKGFSISMSDSEETETSAHISSIPKAQVSTLWMLQEVDGYEEDKKKMKDRGAKMLSSLNKIRIGLLMGEITGDDIETLKSSLDDAKLELQFPELQEVIDEIKLRAEVELAKLERIE